MAAIPIAVTCSLHALHRDLPGGAICRDDLSTTWHAPQDGRHRRTNRQDTMKDLLIIDIPDELHLALAQRAARHGRRLEDEAICILREALGLEPPAFTASGPHASLPDTRPETTQALPGQHAPKQLRPADYAQLSLLVWNRDPNDLIDEATAFALYEANWRHVDEASLQPAERALIARLTAQHGHGVMNV